MTCLLDMLTCRINSNCRFFEIEMLQPLKASQRLTLVDFKSMTESVKVVLVPGGGGVLDQWLGIGVPLRVSNPDPV